MSKYKYIKVGDGILPQITLNDHPISPYLFCKRKKCTVIISDVGDYSIFIRKNLTRVKGVLIKAKKTKWFETKNIVPTSSGSMLYFEEPVGEIFKKDCIYPAIIYKSYTIDDLLGEVYKPINLKIEEYLWQTSMK